MPSPAEVERIATNLAKLPLDAVTWTPRNMRLQREFC
jgi:hypothetical protein